MESTFAEDLQNGLQNGEVLPDKEEAETLMKEPVQKSFEKLQKGKCWHVQSRDCNNM